MAVIQQKSMSNLPDQRDRFQPSSQEICDRCEGLLIKTFCICPAEGIADFEISTMKCLQCGDLFDSTILENRWRSQNHSRTHKSGGEKP